MSVLDIIQKEIDIVNAELSSLNIDLPNVKDEVRDLLLGNSKRIRSVLTLLYLKASNINISKKTIQIMAIGEIIHNASLLHDDVIDNENIRRNKETINSIYSPNVAILSGDYLLTLATSLLLSLDNKQISNIFLNCTQNMCKAEIMQFFYRGQAESIEEYLQICEGKTACLFMAILKSCLINEGADSEEGALFAKNFGIVFQLNNDLKDSSRIADERNNIVTAKDILGIEKMYDLMDNYRRRVLKSILSLNKSKYRDALEDLLKTYDR